MSIHAIADTHLAFFPGSDKPMDVFGSRWNDHENRLKENWVRQVAPEDTVVIAGDISWGIKLQEAKYDLDWIHTLPGRKVLIKGNHDLWWNGIRRLNSLYDDIRFLQYDCVMVGSICICGSRGWLTPDNDDFGAEDESIYRREILRLEMSLEAGKKAMMDAEDPVMIGFMHYPPVIDMRIGSGFHDLFRKYGVKDVYYGHIHGEDSFKTAIQGDVDGVRYHLISLDYLDCRPLIISE